MDLSLIVFLLGTFVAAFVTGVAGFAFGLVAAAFWFHALTPLQTATLISACALLVQGYAVWQLRQKINLRRLAPFMVGSALGIPAGTALLDLAAPTTLRVCVGAVLIGFSIYSLARPQLLPFRAGGRLADAAAGVLNGVLGAATGLAGVVLVIWCALRGWSRDEQRAIFQPTAVITFLLILVSLGGSGRISPDTVQLFALGLPALVVGTWVGWKIYRYLDEGAFRKIVLVLLLASGTALVLT